MTDKERLTVMKAVEEAARSRKKMQGKLDVGDFFAGAMCAMQAMGEKSPPAAWVLGIMSDRPEMYGMTEEKQGE